MAAALMGTQGARGAVNKKPAGDEPSGFSARSLQVSMQAALNAAWPSFHQEHPRRHPCCCACQGCEPSVGMPCGSRGDSPWGGHRHAGKSQVQVLRSSGCTSTISATQFHLRTSFRITSSANQPGGGRSRYSIAVMVRRGQARRAARGVLAVWAQGPVSGPETNREAGARPI